MIFASKFVFLLLSFLSCAAVVPTRLSFQGCRSEALAQRLSSLLAGSVFLLYRRIQFYYDWLWRSTVENILLQYSLYLSAYSADRERERVVTAKDTYLYVVRSSEILL